MITLYAARFLTIAVVMALMIAGFGYVLAGWLGAVGLVVGAIIYVLVAEALGIVTDALDACERQNRARSGAGFDSDWNDGDGGWDFD